LVIDFFKNISNNWKNYIKNPFSNESESYLTDLTNRNLNINTERKNLQDRLILPNNEYKVWGNEADEAYTEKIWEKNYAPKYGDWKSLTEDQRYDAWKKHKYSRPGWFNDTKLGDDLHQSGAMFDKDVATRKELEGVNKQFNDQLIETGAGIASIYSAQKEYDQKPQEKFNLDFTNNKGIMRSQDGGRIPTSSLGLYKYPGQPVNVPSGNITMDGINHPVLAVPNADSPKIMYPNKQYQFQNSKSVLEIPILNMQQGGDTSYTLMQYNDIDDEDVKEQIKRHEGSVVDKYGKHVSYADSRGFKTIGYGHLWKKGDPTVLTQKQAEDLFNKDYRIHKKHAENIPGYNRANSNQKKALINLTYNMGADWYKKFPKFTEALVKGDTIAAAEQLKKSKWAKQVGKRSDAVINTFLSDDNNITTSYPVNKVRENVTERAFDFLGTSKQQHKAFYDGLDFSSIYNNSETV
jgi:lysozyme